MKKSKLIIIVLSALIILFFVIQINKDNYRNQRVEALKSIDNSKVSELYFFKEFPFKSEYIKYKKPIIYNYAYQRQEGFKIFEGWYFGDVNKKSQLDLKTTFLNDGELKFDETTLYKHVNIETMEKVKVKGVEGAYSLFIISKDASHLPNFRNTIYQEALYFVLEGVEYSVTTTYVNEEPFGSDYLIEIINNNLIKKD